MKKEANKKNALNPMPKVIVTVRDKDGNDNALVVGYCGNCSYAPPMVMIGIVPSRYSYHMIKENKVFVVHLVTKDQTELYNACGKKSGRDGDKFAGLNIKLSEGKKVNAKVIEDCPVAIECSVVNSIMTGSHEMFIGKVEYVHANEELIDENGNLDTSSLDLM